MSGGELFCALFFHPPSFLIDTNWIVDTNTTTTSNMIEDTMTTGTTTWAIPLECYQRLDRGINTVAILCLSLRQNMVKLNRITFGCTVCPRTISAFRKLLAALLIRRDSIKLSLKYRPSAWRWRKLGFVWYKSKTLKIPIEM